MTANAGQSGDYGQDLWFGTFLTPSADDPGGVLELARATELAGLDLVSIQDHPYQARFLDAWTLLSVIAAQTTTVRVAPNVANLPLRLPSVLARSAASLDILSGGRVELGLGAGAFWDPIVAMGGTRRTPKESVDALVEALAVIRAMWDTGERSVRLDGTYYPVKGAHTGPAPTHDIEIWLGAYKRRMLTLTGSSADGWVPSQGYVAPDALAAMNDVIDDAARAAGREPADIRRLYNINGPFRPVSRPAEWAEQLAELTLTHGISAYVLAADDVDLIQAFGNEVAPAVRELVDAERARRADAGATTAEERTQERSVTAAAAAGAVTSAPLQVVPTPDDGMRLSVERLWDEDSRPSAPPPDPDRTYTPHEQAQGRHLVDVHDALRSELTQLRDLVQQVADGTVTAAHARSMINTMTMRQNNWTLGVYCASYCRIVSGHHSLEDRSVFPHLRTQEPRLAPVIDRLEEEHHVIAGVLDRVDAALVALVSGPSEQDVAGGHDGIDQVRAAVDLLTDTLLSHLAYEERELVEPLARFGFL